MVCVVLFFSFYNIYFHISKEIHVVYPHYTIYSTESYAKCYKNSYEISNNSLPRGCVLVFLLSHQLNLPNWNKNEAMEKKKKRKPQKFDHLTVILNERLLGMVYIYFIGVYLFEYLIHMVEL